MVLNNDTSSGQHQKMFDCSWISCHSDENERLFIGYAGMAELRIESITIIENNKKYNEYIHALFIWDMMLSGVDMRKIRKGDIAKTDAYILNKLIDHKFGAGSKKNSVHIEYILDCFDLWLHKKAK